MPRAALSVDLATPTTTLCRGLDGQAGQAGPYAEGPDFWPSAYKKALDVSRHSCSGGTKWKSAAAALGSRPRFSDNCAMP
jgi:hypothetical protein